MQDDNLDRPLQLTYEINGTTTRVSHGRLVTVSWTILTSLMVSVVCANRMLRQFPARKRLYGTLFKKTVAG